jgi:hypothetical protein
LNPYRSTVATQHTVAEAGHPRHDTGVIVISAVLILASIIAILSLFVPAINEFVMPRFGWSGLILCLNPLIFLGIWFKIPAPKNLSAAAAMCGVIGVLNAFQLRNLETVATVQNVFHDRLHSSWAWSVVPFVLAAGYLGWRAFCAASHSRKSNSKATD